MERLLNYVRYDRNVYFDKINKLLHSNKTIGIYGAGVYAKYIEQVLNRWGIIISFCVVDDEYYKTTVCYNKELIKFNEMDKIDNAILIIGFEITVGDEKLLQEKSNQILYINPKIELIDFENCYLDWDYVDYPFFLNHYNDFEKTYRLLEDDFSRRIMIEYLNSSISGKSRDFCILKTDHIHDYEYDIMFGNTERISGFVIDCGAYDGKTAIEIFEYLKDKEASVKVLAVEPDDNNIRTIIEKCKKYSNIIPIKRGISNKNETLYFESSGGQIGKIVYPKEGEDLSQYHSIDTVNIDTLDTQLSGDIIAILMDVEGSEIDALYGASEVIKKYKPALAVRVYHKKTDLLTIPLFLDSLFEGDKYKLYLRNNAKSRGILDLTLYAVF